MMQMQNGSLSGSGRSREAVPQEGFSITTGAVTNKPGPGPIKHSVTGHLCHRGAPRTGGA